MEHIFNYTPQKGQLHDLTNGLHEDNNVSYARMPFNETDEFFNNTNANHDSYDESRELFKNIYKNRQKIKRNGTDHKERFGNTLLFQNKFVEPKVHNTRDDEHAIQTQQKFREYYEEKQKAKNMAIMPPENLFDAANNDLADDIDILDPSDLLLTNAVNDMKNTEAENLKAINQQNNTDQRFFKNQRTLINIDSRDRDKTIYPFHNHYKVSLGRPFYNVKKIIMRSSEFPNTEQLIRDTPLNKANNKIYWRNAGTSTIYTASIPPGNYRPSSLQTQIQVSMNQVRRIIPSEDPLDADTFTFHEFTVSIDTVSDICSFSSLSSRQVAGPFFTTAGSSAIIVKIDSHGFLDGQLINISGAISFAGVNLSLVNTNHVIQFIDDNSFIIDIGTNIVETAGNDTDGGVGGNQVRVGTGLEFQLLFSIPGTPANILGFENVDTDFSTLHQNTIIDKTYEVERVQGIDTIYSVVSIKADSITADNPYLLEPADPVFLVGVSGTGTDELVNIPSGYSITPLTNLDIDYLTNSPNSNPTWTPEEFARSFKIPAPIALDKKGTLGVINTRTLNRPVTLAGENYIFMLVMPQQNIILGDMSNSGTVSNIFSKINLSAPPGNILYNTFISNGKTFLDTPLREISEMEFVFKDQNDALFDFIDSHHSFTLEIVEQIHILESEGIQYNSRIGQSDKT